MTTLRQKIGQMLILGFDGTVIDKAHPMKRCLSEDGLGGVILFDKDAVTQKPGKNLQSKEQIIHLNRQLRSYSELPLFIAIDYEGGAVDRLKNIPDVLTTLKPSLLATFAEAERRAILENMADTLKTLGFNLNFAPLLDLNLNDKEGIIGNLGRCFSALPEEVISMAKEFVSIFAKKGIYCCYKHFPGHGSAIGDSHEGFVDVSGTFQYAELLPYEMLLKEYQNNVMIMTAHVINRELDPEGLPATLSEAMLKGLLRDKLQFGGVIISDDLQMKAIADHFSLKEALRLSINAGADMLIFANQLGFNTAAELIDCLEKMVESGEISVARIEESYRRIIALKQDRHCERSEAIQ